jgi:sulfatase maturation enzyme AslB (radical SAM superfamily)
MERVINIVDYHQRKNNKQVLFNKQITNLSKCSNPWTNLIINQFGTAYICSSPAWLPKGIGSLLDYDSPMELLNSYEARAIRSEVSLGRYSYCNNKLCYYLPTNIQGVPTDLLTEDQFTADSVLTELPHNLCFDFDFTCNFKCPSCRQEIINYNQGSMADIMQSIVDKSKLLLDTYANSNTKVLIRWAGGEPFVSKAYLQLWQHILKLNNKNIRNIIQTNGSYLKKKSKLLKEFLPYIDAIRISFDAGTASTYKINRVNGNWNTLLNNSKFLKELIDHSEYDIKLVSDFVVQLNNYKEIPKYVETVNLLNFDKINISKMWNWDTWPMEEFERLNISDPTHPNNKDLVSVLAPYFANPRMEINIATDTNIINSV